MCTHLPEHDFLSTEKVMRKPDFTLHIVSTLLSDNRPASGSERSFLVDLGYLRKKKKQVMEHIIEVVSQFK